MADEAAMEETEQTVNSPNINSDTAVGSPSLCSKSSVNVEKLDNVCCVHGMELYASLKSSSVQHENKTVGDIFKEGFNLFDNVSKSEGPTNSVETQAKVKKAMNLFEEATRLVSTAGVFSRNESIEEVSTKDVKYLLLPALLGTLSLKLCVENRIEVVHTAEVYFRDFLQRCKDYGVADFEIPPPDEEPSEDAVTELPARPTMDLVAMARERNLKIQRYKELKELEAKLKELKLVMDTSQVSEEFERNFYITMIKTYINQSFDELNSLKMEKPILAHMAKVKKEMPLGLQGRKEKVRRFERKPLTPIIITKDEVQKKVYGAGYPSIPTMTVAEFYDKKVKDGEFPDPSKSQPLNALQDHAPIGALEEIAAATEEEIAQKELIEESDDPENLQKVREWDDWKDDHRRGWGNRMNRS